MVPKPRAIDSDRIKPVHRVSTIFLENHCRNQVPICWWDIWILTGRSDVNSLDVLKLDPVSSMKPKLMKPGSSTGDVSLGNLMAWFTYMSDNRKYSG